MISGSEVRTGKRPGSDEWGIQSVLIPEEKVSGESEAKKKALEIVDKIT